MRRSAWLFSLAFAVPFAGYAGPVYADEPDASSQAQALFEEGRTLMDNGKPKEACEKFTASNKVDRSAGTLLNLGRCLEAQGKTASALEMYKEAITVGKEQNKQRHVEAAEQYITSLEPHLSRLTVEAPEPVDGLSIVRTNTDGASVTLAENDRGVGVAVDPSTYTVEATAPGYAKWTTTVDVGKGADLTVTVPALRPSSEGDTHSPATSSWKPDALFIAGAATAGVGLVGVAVGTAFGVMTMDDVSEATSTRALCPKYACSARGQAFIDNTQTEATVSTVGLTIGIAAAATGGTLMVWSLLHRDKPKSASAPIVLPVVSLGPAPVVGIAIRGSM